MAIRRSRTELRETWPFRTYEQAFDNCALRLDTHEQFDPGRSTFTVEVEQVGGPALLHVELKLEVSAKAIGDATRIDVDNIDVAVLVQNDDAKRHEDIQRWPLQSLKHRHEFRISDSRYGPRRIYIVLAAYLNTEIPVEPGRAWRRGSLLSERRFVIVTPASASLFRVDFTEFSKHGWNPDALWHVDFSQLEAVAELSPEEIVEVHLNAELPVLATLFQAKATRMPKLSSVAAVVRPLVTAEILFDVFAEVLRAVGRLQEDDSVFSLDALEPGSLAERVVTTIREQTHLDPAAAVDAAASNPALLKETIHGLVGVGRAYSQRNLDRLRAR